MRRSKSPKLLQLRRELIENAITIVSAFPLEMLERVVGVIGKNSLEAVLGLVVELGEAAPSTRPLLPPPPSPDSGDGEGKDREEQDGKHGVKQLDADRRRRHS